MGPRVGGSRLAGLHRRSRLGQPVGRGAAAGTRLALGGGPDPDAADGHDQRGARRRPAPPRGRARYGDATGSGQRQCRPPKARRSHGRPSTISTPIAINHPMQRPRAPPMIPPAMAPATSMTSAAHGQSRRERELPLRPPQGHQVVLDHHPEPRWHQQRQDRPGVTGVVAAEDEQHRLAEHPRAHAEQRAEGERRGNRPLHAASELLLTDVRTVREQRGRQEVRRQEDERRQQPRDRELRVVHRAERERRDDRDHLRRGRQRQAQRMVAQGRDR